MRPAQRFGLSAIKKRDVPRYRFPLLSECSYNIMNNRALKAQRLCGSIQQRQTVAVLARAPSIKSEKLTPDSLRVTRKEQLFASAGVILSRQITTNRLGNSDRHLNDRKKRKS